MCLNYTEECDGAFICPCLSYRSDKCEMRDATKEEQESVDNHIKSISTNTGVNFWDRRDKV